MQTEDTAVGAQQEQKGDNHRLNRMHEPEGRLVNIEQFTPGKGGFVSENVPKTNLDITGNSITSFLCHPYLSHNLRLFDE